MSLPKIKPLEFISKPIIENNNTDLAIIVIDETDIEKGTIHSSELTNLDSQFNGIIQKLISFGDFEGKWLQSTVSISDNSKISKRIVLIGAGKKQDIKPSRARQIGIKSAEIALALKTQQVTFLPYSKLINSKELIAQVHAGFNLGMYKYPNSNATAQAMAESEKPLQVTYISNISGCQEELNHTEIINNSVNTCRLLQDGAPNIATPKYIAENIAEQAKKLNLNVQIWGAQKLKEMGFNAMLAVAGGSALEPQFVVIEYKPEKFSKTIAFVGKGLTVDTGGYSLKTPSIHQEGMKYDMSGSAVTLSSILAIARQKLPIHVYAVGALCENMVDALAFRVGDIITGYSGKTIEVLNTDAEGRLVLSDALHYAAKDLKPDYIVEYSTLTGAMIGALGHVGAGVFAFDKELEQIVIKASEETGERAYPLPVWEEIADDNKGSITDLVNLGKNSGGAGSMVAAAFLKEFTEDIPFAHIDIAGVSDKNQAIGYTQKGSSGYGVQLSVQIAKKISGLNS
ncbi:leucyl aminopeptidase family protein [Fluviispira sanaruensis]|uniref:Probable cytosol aminopeptidase n=1 Tax=Fluviispira sanaruensis TaxID=2493639 RepID=A0A4P2VT28_FLUSA|nr:leucyl aminopeptidase [Fluviispira sanaruensis]BBH52012.1 cytosol aminopeptidase [Fluviispira sanaruensis]